MGEKIRFIVWNFFLTFFIDFSKSMKIKHMKPHGFFPFFFFEWQHLTFKGLRPIKKMDGSGYHVGCLFFFFFFCLEGGTKVQKRGWMFPQPVLGRCPIPVVPAPSPHLHVILYHFLTYVNESLERASFTHLHFFHTMGK